MLSHRVIWHGRRVCHARKPGLRRLPDRPAVPVVRRGPDRPGRRARSWSSPPSGRVTGLRWPSRARGVPDWLRPLADGGARPRAAEELSRFLPPEDGSGRASAVLMAFADERARRRRACC